MLNPVRNFFNGSYCVPPLLISYGVNLSVSLLSK